MVNLRALEPEDIDLLYRWENNKDIWQVSNTQTPFSKFVLSKYLENAHLDIYQARQLRLMIDVEQSTDQPQTIGAVDLFDFDPFHLRAGVGILIANTKDRNRGYASLALKELINYAFKTLCLHQLYCNIGLDNKVSLKLFSGLGFKTIGIKKDWIRTDCGYSDEVILQLINK